MHEFWRSSTCALNSDPKWSKASFTEQSDLVKSTVMILILAKFSYFQPKFVPKFTLKFRSSPCFRCVCVMWSFSDLHALEVELWIHCFCTRCTPFKSSDCYHANLCLVWRFFSYDLFFCHNISLSKSKTNNQCRDLTETQSGIWIGIWVLEISCTSV